MLPYCPALLFFSIVILCYSLYCGQIYDDDDDEILLIDGIAVLRVTGHVRACRSSVDFWRSVLIAPKVSKIRTLCKFRAVRKSNVTNSVVT